MASPPVKKARELDHHATNLRSWTIGLSITLFALPTILVSLRIYANTLLTRRAGRTDVVGLIAWALYSSTFISGWFALRVVRETHVWNITAEELGALLKHLFIASSLNIISIFTVKLAIFLQLIEIFAPKGLNRRVYWSINVVIGLNSIFYTIAFAYPYVVCRPLKRIWSPLMPGGNPLHILRGVVVIYAVNTLSDIAILLLPQICIWKLQMPIKKKVQTSAIFAFGALGCAVSIAQIYNSVQAVRTGDLSFYGPRTLLCVWAEHTCAFIALCLPAAIKAFRAGIDWIKSRLNTIDACERGYAGTPPNRPSVLAHIRLQAMERLPSV